jgi:hypothetical protein
MKFKSFSPFIFVCLLLSGCASFNISDLINSQNVALESGRTDIPLSLSYSNSKDYREKNCRKVWMSNDTKISYETIQEKSSEDHTFYLNTPIRHFQGIKTTVIHDGKLQISFWGKGEVEEYSAPIYRTVSLENFEARPAGTLVWSTLGLGLPLLLNPSGTAKRAFGCTDETVNRKYANVTHKQKTGKAQWTDFYRRQTLVITGLGNAFEVNVVPNLKSGIGIIDLTDNIKKNPLPDIIKINVDCVTCVIEIDKEQSIASMASKSSTLTYDIGSFKRMLVERDEALAKSQVKDPIPAPLANKKSDTVNLKSDSSKIETATQRCKKLGLLESSSDFSLCVKSLTK